MEKCSSVPGTPKIISLGFSDTLRFILLTDAQNNKAHMLTDTVQISGDWMLRCQVQFLGQELGGTILAALPVVCTASVTAHCQMNTERCFRSLPFFVKAKILFGFLSVTIKPGTDVDLS